MGPLGDLYLIFLFVSFLPILNCQPGKQGMSSSLHSSQTVFTTPPVLSFIIIIFLYELWLGGASF